MVFGKLYYHKTLLQIFTGKVTNVLIDLFLKVQYTSLFHQLREFLSLFVFKKIRMIRFMKSHEKVYQDQVDIILKNHGDCYPC